MTLFSINFFADNTSLLSTVYDINVTKDVFNEELE